MNFDWQSTVLRLVEGVVLVGLSIAINTTFPEVIDPITHTRCSVITLWCGVAVFASHGIRGTGELIKFKKALKTLMSEDALSTEDLKP